MLTASLPYPPHQGGAIRGYGILKGLHAAGHSVTLLSFHDPDQGIQVDETPLVNFCEQIITVSLPVRSTRDRLQDLLLTSQADIARRLESDAMHTQLKQLLQDNTFDLIQFEGIEITNYLFAAQQLRPEIATIYDSFNAEAALQKVIAQVDRGEIRKLPRATYSYIQSQRIEAFERAICETATAVIAVSQEDADLLNEFRAQNDVYVVPSGIFTDEYVHPDHSADLLPNSLVFTGKMDYRPNVDAMLWFCEHVLPGVRANVEANVYIVGQKPHPQLDALRMNPHIHITGWVAEIQPYLHAAENVRPVEVYEALQRGTIDYSFLNAGNIQQYKLYEPGKYSCGPIMAITGHNIVIGKNTWNKLPKRHSADLHGSGQEVACRVSRVAGPTFEAAGGREHQEGGRRLQRVPGGRS